MNESILLVNACVRKESRTRKLAAELLSRLGKPYEEIRLSEIAFPTSDEAFLHQRDQLISEGDFGNPLFALARQFAGAETIVIAAPYWDLSFPAMLKQYLEQICVLGITFKYTEEGIPVGLCSAKRLYYVTTAGGPYLPDYSYSYIRALAVQCFGIRETELFRAEMLDVAGFDAEEIVDQTIRQL